MPVEFKLPDVGEGLAEAEIVGWLVEVGDAVTEDQPVAEVETDKAVVEVPSPVNGTVQDIRAEAGEVVPVGEVIVVFATDDETVETAEPTAEPPGASGTEGTEADTEAPTGSGRTFAPPRVRRLARELGVDLATVDGSGEGGRLTEGDVRAAAAGGAEPTEPEPEAAGNGADTSAPEPSTDEGVTAPPSVTSEAADRDRTLAAPATRGVARELGVDLDAVPAVEERDGEAFVTAEQVRQYAEAQQQAQTESAEAVTTETGERVERVPYRGLRRTIGERMERSKFTIPHVSAYHHPDVEELVEARADLKARAEDRGVRLTYMPFVMKATVSALQAYPMFNAELDEENEEVVHKRYYNIGVATATEDGLLVPVVEDVDQKGLLELAEEVNDLAERGRERSLSPSELRGGTFTISNFGAISGEYASPIINYPEVGILGLGTLKQRPRVVDGEVVPRHTMPLSLSFDHRVADGLDAGRFANHIIERLENPLRLLL